MTAAETLELIAKNWCNLNDLMKLAGVGRNNALFIKSTIKKKLESENYYVPNNAVNIYKSDSSWSSYADHIYPIS